MTGKQTLRGTLPTAAVAGFMLASSAATAAPIEGGLGLSGDYEAQDSSGNKVEDLTNADFLQSFDPTIDATDTSGDLTAVPDGTVVNSYEDFALDGSGLPFQPLWSIDDSDGNTFELELTSFSITTRSADTLVFDGSGTLTSTDPNLDPASAVWDATFNSTGTGSLNVQTFSDTSIAQVPMPNTLVLLGVGFLGLGLLGRRRFFRRQLA